MDPLASSFFSEVRAEVAKKAKSLPVSDLATRTARLAQISLRLVNLGGFIHKDEMNLRCVMSERDRAFVESGYRRSCAERDRLIAERTELHQNPPQGRQQRVSELTADIAAHEQTLTMKLNPWLRGVNEDAVGRLQLELADLNAAIAAQREAA